MKNSLVFEIPFSGFCGMTFINCFTSIYLFLENIAAGGIGSECRHIGGLPCGGRDGCDGRDICGKGGNTSNAMHDKYFFLFDTICGRSSLRSRFDGKPTKAEKMICETDFYDGGTKNNIDFLFGFTGYSYRKITDSREFKSAIVKSVDAGKPVIAKVKDGENRFRVVTGYDSDALICPNFACAQKKPASPPLYEELDTLYIIGESIAPRFSLSDSLERIRRIMEYNTTKNFWNGYLEKFGAYPANTAYSVNAQTNISQDEEKARMKRVTEAMRQTADCYSFAELFRNLGDIKGPPVYAGVNDINKLRDPKFRQLVLKISEQCYNQTHSLAQALISLDEYTDLPENASGFFGELVRLAISRIAKNDEDVLDAVKEIISKL